MRYRCDWHRVIPARRMYSQKRRGYVDLIEDAVALAPGEYGRITYNGRFVDCDTGIWHYRIDILNILHTQEQLPLAIFVRLKPDRRHDQIARLI